MVDENKTLFERHDNEWIRQIMFIPRMLPSKLNNGRAQHIARNRQFTQGMLNFGDTTLGGNRSINPRPQFTEFADQNVDTLLMGASPRSLLNGTSQGSLINGGMGRFYAEAIDNNAQRIFMDFGIPMYNSLGNFFTEFYDEAHGKLANQGVWMDVAYTGGKVLGYVFLWWLIIPIRALQGVSNIVSFLRRRPASRYYFMKPTMHLYWTMVTTIVDTMTINMGLSPGYDPANYQEENTLKQSDGTVKASNLSKADFDAYQRILPDIFSNSNGGINARMVGTRYQRLANKHREALQKVVEGTTTPEQAYAAIVNHINKNRRREYQPLTAEQMERYKMQDFQNHYKKSPAGRGEGLKDISMVAAEGAAAKAMEEKTTDPNGILAQMSVNIFGSETKATPTPLAEQNNAESIAATKAADAAAAHDLANAASAEGLTGVGDKQGFWDGIGKWFSENNEIYWGTVRDGLAWVSFVVDYQSGISESVSNSTRSSSVADTMNSTSSESRNKIFNMAGGNLGDNPAANLMEGVLGGIKSVVQGGLNAIGLQGLSALGGAAFVDIPDFWSDSSVSLPTNSYTIQLRSPYGNPMSIFQNIYFPLAMLLAGAVPRSTGKSSYTAPFLCRLWHKGRSQVQLGIISDLSISRGTSNVAWNVRDQAVAIDVSFTVTNLSKMLHMPISPDTGLKDLFGFNMFNEDTNFTDYMAVLAGMGLPEQYYHLPNLKRQWHLSRTRWDSWWNTANFWSWGVHETLPGNILNSVAMDSQFY